MKHDVPNDALKERVKGTNESREKEDNPYTSLQKAWSDKLQKAERRNSVFALAIVIETFALFSCVLAVVYLALFRAPTPYVLEIDDTNRVSFGGLLATNDTTIKDEWIPSQLISFVQNWRTVTPDNTMQKRMITHLYCMLPENQQSMQRLNEYFRQDQNNPFELNTSVSVNTQISSILRQTANSWIVEWTETVRAMDGSLRDKPVTYKANLLIARGEPAKDCYEGNPLGLYIRQMDWTTVQKLS